MEACCSGHVHFSPPGDPHTEFGIYRTIPTRLVIQTGEVDSVSARLSAATDACCGVVKVAEGDSEACGMNLSSKPAGLGGTC